MFRNWFVFLSSTVPAFQYLLKIWIHQFRTQESKKMKKTINASAVRSTTIFMIASNYYIDAIRRFGIHCLLRSIRLAISFFRSFYSEWTANRVCEFINQNDANQFKLTPHTICAACIAANKHHMCDRYGKTCWNRFNWFSTDRIRFKWRHTHTCSRLAICS